MLELDIVLVTWPFQLVNLHFEEILELDLEEVVLRKKESGYV